MALVNVKAETVELIDFASEAEELDWAKITSIGTVDEEGGFDYFSVQAGRLRDWTARL